MKKIIIILIAGPVLALAGSYGVYAQSSVPMLKNIRTADTLVGAVSDEPINSRAVRYFNRSFKDIKDAEWSRIKEGGFLCKFMEKGILKRVYFDPTGNWQYTIAGYNEAKLPRDIRALVKGAYYDYAITYIQQINTVKDNKTAYLVQVQDETKLMVLRVVDGETEVIGSYNK